MTQAFAQPVHIFRTLWLHGRSNVWKFANVAVHLSRVSGCWLTSAQPGLNFRGKTCIHGDLTRNRQFRQFGSKTRSLTLELTWNGTSQDNLLIRRPDQWRLRLVSGYTLIGYSRFQTERSLPAAACGDQYKRKNACGKSSLVTAIEN
jgi:hypothetical protein